MATPIPPSGNGRATLILRGVVKVTGDTRIKILTVLNGVSGNALGKGTAGAFGACGAVQTTLYQGVPERTRAQGKF